MPTLQDTQRLKQILRPSLAYTTYSGIGWQHTIGRKRSKMTASAFLDAINITTAPRQRYPLKPKKPANTPSNQTPA